MNTKIVILNRFKIKDNYTLGHCYIKHENNRIEYIGCTLERGWQDNQKRISCVPQGTYLLVLENSPRFNKDLWELKNVPNRSECKFHAANYWKQLNGCISLGTKHLDINGDGDPDVTSSRKTMAKFHKAMGNSKLSKVIIKDL